MTRCRQVRCEFTNAQLRVVGLVRCVLPEEETAGEAAGTHACWSNVDSSSKSTVSGKGEFDAMIKTLVCRLPLV